MTFVLTEDGDVLTDDDGTPNTFDTRAEAKGKQEEIGSLFSNLEVEQQGVEEVEAEVITMSDNTGGNNSDNGDNSDNANNVENVDNVGDDEPMLGVDVCSQCGSEIENGHCPNCEGDAQDAVDAVEAIDTVKDSGLDTDPLSVLPEFMTDTIQGAEAVNKRGYAMIAERYDIEVSAELLESPWDNDEGRVVCKATAITDDDKTYNAYGTACAGDGDDSAQLIELADTRSQKRAVQWASGFGIVGYQELTGQLEGDGA